MHFLWSPTSVGHWEIADCVRLHLGRGRYKVVRAMKLTFSSSSLLPSTSSQISYIFQKDKRTTYLFRKCLSYLSFLGLRKHHQCSSRILVSRLLAIVQNIFPFLSQMEVWAPFKSHKCYFKKAFHHHSHDQAGKCSPRSSCIKLPAHPRGTLQISCRLSPMPIQFHTCFLTDLNKTLYFTSLNWGEDISTKSNKSALATDGGHHPLSKQPSSWEL